MSRSISALIFFFFFSVTGAAAQANVMARVTNFTNNKGVCMACIFNNAKAFNGDGVPVQCERVIITNKESLVEFKGLPAGKYAISVFHDANQNGKFDTNFFGIPREGYGASGNKLPFASAPNFTDNSFTISTTTINLTIKLRNL